MNEAPTLPPLKPACAYCRFAVGFPKPGPAPVRPAPPTGFWARLFFDHEKAHWDYSAIEAAHADAARCHSFLVRCHLMPAPVTKRRTDFCGQYQPA